MANLFQSKIKAEKQDKKISEMVKVVEALQREQAEQAAKIRHMQKIKEATRDITAYSNGEVSQIDAEHKAIQNEMKNYQVDVDMVI